jgi:hypothetical protein
LPLLEISGGGSGGSGWLEQQVHPNPHIMNLLPRLMV